MAPSMEQYAGELPVAATQRGAASVTAATGSPIAATGIIVPSRGLAQSSADTVLAAGDAGPCDGQALAPNTDISNVASAASIRTNRRFSCMFLSPKVFKRARSFVGNIGLPA
jgi:hypothetical protein